MTGRDREVESVTGDQNAANRALALRLIDNLLARPDFMRYSVGDVRALHYAEACAGSAALALAGDLGDPDRVAALKARYSVELENTANHVDANVCGILPLEIYLQTSDPAFLERGLSLADGQWESPLENGMTRQTRYWIDDVYMVASLQVQAFRATGNRTYLDWAALQTEAYLKRLQTANGLFYHGENARFYWGRGNGWVAAGLALLLSALDPCHERYGAIRDGFLRMAESLARYQCEDGMWRQLIDRDHAWKEASCTAMFAYAFRIGVTLGLLPSSSYSERVDRAWASFRDYIDGDGNVSEICGGTGQSENEGYYLARPRITGDLHGQAAALWLFRSMLDKGWN